MSGGSGNGSSPTSLKSSYDEDLSSSFSLPTAVMNPEIPSTPHSQVNSKMFACRKC